MNESGKPRDKLAIVLMAIMFGMWGIHDFFLGRKEAGIVKLMMTACVVIAIVVLLGSDWDWMGAFYAAAFGWGLLALWAIADAIRIAKDRTEGAWK